MRPTLAVAAVTGRVLVRHLERTVGGRSIALVIATTAVIALVAYNVTVFSFLTRFLPADTIGASLLDTGQLVATLAAAQVSSAGGVAVLVMVLAPGQSAVRISAQVLSAGRWAARVGESVPFVVLVAVSSGSLTIGPSVYLATLVPDGLLAAPTFIAVDVATALGIVLVAEVVRWVGAAARLNPSALQLIAVLSAVAMVAVSVLDSIAAARAARTPAAATWTAVLTGMRGVDASVAAFAATLCCGAVLLAAVLLVRSLQRSEPLAHPQRILTVRWLPRRCSWFAREVVMTVRHPIGQVSLAVAIVAVVLLGWAARSGTVPVSVALSIVAMLAAAPLELSWGRTAKWQWLYRFHRVSAARIVAAQSAVGLLWALVLGALMFGLIGAVPRLALVLPHAVVFLAVACIAYEAGVLAPADAEVPASVAVTSVLAVLGETVAVWAGSELDGLRPGLGSAFFVVVALAAFLGSCARVRRRLYAD